MPPMTDARMKTGKDAAAENGTTVNATYNFAFLDEQTKRMIRRALLKAVAIPGYQVPFASREMPMPYGWGTGGIQVTASVIGPEDVLKVIDQGSDDTTNAIGIRKFSERTTGVETTEKTAAAPFRLTGSQAPLSEGDLIHRVPIHEPLRLEQQERNAADARAGRIRTMHVKLYEDIARHGHIATTYAYQVKVAGRYVMDPRALRSTIPKWTPY